MKHSPFAAAVAIFLSMSAFSAWLHMGAGVLVPQIFWLLGALTVLLSALPVLLSNHATD